MSDIKKLIVLLGSPQDGEVVAAARALVRTLKARDMDLHDFAAMAEQMGTMATDDDLSDDDFLKLHAELFARRNAARDRRRQAQWREEQLREQERPKRRAKKNAMEEEP